jgi:hypothetical protein
MIDFSEEIDIFRMENRNKNQIKPYYMKRKKPIILTLDAITNAKKLTNEEMMSSNFKGRHIIIIEEAGKNICITSG